MSHDSFLRFKKVDQRCNNFLFSYLGPALLCWNSAVNWTMLALCLNLITDLVFGTKTPATLSNNQEILKLRIIGGSEDKEQENET